MLLTLNKCFTLSYIAFRKIVHKTQVFRFPNKDLSLCTLINQIKTYYIGSKTNYGVIVEILMRPHV